MINPRLSSFASNTSISGRSQKSMSTSRLSSFANVGRRSVFGASTSRNNSILNASLQTTQLIEDTGAHLVENFGIPLPVLVTEALTQIERNRDVSACLDSNGWAWLVCGRRLFVWKYKLLSTQRLSAAPQCRELTLPYSDLAHKANLVCVLTKDEQQIPAAVVVSPEGTIRYWPNIAHEGSSVELSVELNGQECTSLTNCQPFGCVLATTTCTLIMVSASNGGRENSLTTRNLTAAKGVLARFGQRMTSFIFGSIPNPATESRLVRVLVASGDDPKTKLLYILGGNSLQKWEITEDGCDKLLFDYDIESFAREKFVDCLWGREMVHPHQLKVWLIDMQRNEHGLFVLVSAVSPREPQRVRYALGWVDVSAGFAATGFKEFLNLSHSDTFQDEEEDSMLSYCLLLPNSKLDCAYVYRKNIVLCVPCTVSSGIGETDPIGFKQAGDRILGAGSYDGLPLFFSNNHGIVSITASSSDDSVSAGNTSAAADTISECLSVIGNSSRMENVAEGDDKVSRFSVALKCYLQKNPQFQSIVDDLFPYPLSPTPAPEVDSVLDATVLKFSGCTIDDSPATDPRWAESNRLESGGTSSLLILHQLEDKQKVHRLFQSMLLQSGLWERLQFTSVGGHVTGTRRVLCEHAEKLVVAKALRELHSQYGELLDSAIEIALSTRPATKSEGKLSNQDLFYREVSLVQDIIPALLKVEQNVIAEGATRTVVSTVVSVNNILLSVLRQVTQYQQSHSSDVTLDVIQTEGECLPWLSSSDGTALRTWLIQQHRLSLDHAVKAPEDVSSNSAVLQQVMDLSDYVLDGYRCQIQSLDGVHNVDPTHLGTLTRQYEADRSKLIIPLVEIEQYERALALAEKYLDLELLVRICDTTDNQDRLKRYTMQFAEHGFSDFVFNWYIREGKRGKLLSQPLLQQDKLRQLLSNHQNISWLQDIKQGRYLQAHNTLNTLSNDETEVLMRKKHMLSLSKLSALASEMPEADVASKVRDINHEQNLITFQENLPASVLDSYGYDADNMKVLEPTELIRMYVCKENIGANEHDFCKALDLLTYVYQRHPGDYDHWHNHIWCQAILRDSWEDFEHAVDQPLESCRHTLFFKTIEWAFNCNLDLNHVLPKIDRLLASKDLEKISENVTSAYLIKAGYEQLMRQIE